MTLTPNSWGSTELREYNHSHDPHSGEFASRSGGPRLFVDLDGVLADFDKGYHTLTGGRSNRNQPDPPGMWDAIKAAPNFYGNLPPMPGMAALWKAAQAMDPHATILTGVHTGLSDTGQQKRDWVAKHLGPDVPVITSRTVDKHLHGQPGDILIDDYKQTQASWEKMGGVFVQHTSNERTIPYLKGYVHGQTGYGFQKSASGRKGSAQYDAYKAGYYHGNEHSR